MCINGCLCTRGCCCALALHKHITQKTHGRLMGLRGYRIGNVDVTLILQKPKVRGLA